MDKKAELSFLGTVILVMITLVIIALIISGIVNGSFDKILSSIFGF